MEPTNSQNPKRPFSDRDDNSEGGQIIDLQSRFKKLHPTRNSEKKFESFLQHAKEDLVTEYLDQLEKFFSALPESADNGYICRIQWDMFVDNMCPFEGLIDSFSIQHNKKLQTQAVQLALLRKYPQVHHQTGLDIPTMLLALKAQSEEEGCRILKASPKSAHSKVSGSVIKKGYQSPFLKSEIVVDPILEILDKYAKQWEKPTYFAPYTALIGPSTSGKTRLLMEIAQRICVIFICLRPQDSTGYPPRSALADSMVPKASSDIHLHYTSLIVSIFKVAANFFNRQDPAKEKQYRLQEWNDYTEVGSLGPLDMSKRTQKKFTSDVLEEMGKFADCKDTIEEAAEAMSESTMFINTCPSLKVLLAFDEARALLTTPSSGNEISFFRTLRRVILEIEPGMGFFAVLVDTTSHVANFSVASKFDPSARHDFVGENRLFPPIYEIASFDAMVPSDPPRSWEELVSPERLFKYGSPIFGSYFRDAIADQQLPRSIHAGILELARFKLLGPTDSTHQGIVTKSQAFAFLGPTIQPRINGALHLNTELIASHAAHCDYISSGCDMVMSNYPSQFTLAAAALQFLENEDRLIQCIKNLTTIVLHGLDASGGAGELASRIILLRAMQSALAESKEGGIRTGRPVRLVNFLKALTGKEEDDLVLGSIAPKQKKDLLDNGMVFWNHFSLIKYTPTTEHLLQFMYRGMAAQCHPNQPGIDQIFTIYLKRDDDVLDEEKLERGEHALDEKNVSFCGIQVKNRTTDLGVETENYKFTDTFTQVQLQQDNPYLILYMNLNSVKETLTSLPDLPSRQTRSKLKNPAEKPNTNGRRASLSFDGLSPYKCLSQGLIDALKGLITVEPDFVALQRNESGKRYSKIINPNLHI